MKPKTLYEWMKERFLERQERKSKDQGKEPHTTQKGNQPNKETY